jgi:hypothetical protein
MKYEYNLVFKFKIFYNSYNTNYVKWNIQQLNNKLYGKLSAGNNIIANHVNFPSLKCSTLKIMTPLNNIISV